MTRGQRIAHGRVAWALLLVIVLIATGAIALRETGRAALVENGATP